MTPLLAMFVDSEISLMANIAQFSFWSSKHNIPKISKWWWWGGGGTSARKPLLSRYVSFFLQIFPKLANELTHKPPWLV